MELIKVIIIIITIKANMYKLFIGGVSPDTTEDDLWQYFRSFGDLIDYRIVYDNRTGISKGYGFITCENRSMYEKILENKKHFVCGRIVDINKALERDMEVPEEVKNKSLRKLFVGGLSLKIGDDHLFDYFSQFGKVMNAYVIFDPKTKESKSSLSLNL